MIKVDFLKAFDILIDYANTCRYPILADEISSNPKAQPSVNANFMQSCVIDELFHLIWKGHPWRTR